MSVRPGGQVATAVRSRSNRDGILVTICLRTRSIESSCSQVRSNAVSYDAYLQAFSLKYGAKVYKGARRQDLEIAQREVEQLRAELAGVRRAQAGASSSRAAAEGSQLDLEDRLASALGRAEEAQAELIERVTELRAATNRAARLQEEVDAATALAAEQRLQTKMVEELTRELALQRTQGPAVDQAELSRLRTELVVKQFLAQELRGIVTGIGHTWSRSKSRTRASEVSGTSVRQFLASSSSRRRNEEEERRLAGETSVRSGRGGDEMPPPPERHEGCGESGDGQ
ncbi:hypothetical protein Taro_038889 [Colocasia esculenta]|uniref:Uncharacterized protein n=1 Tax=Colocasia esculenta TaxID=4460 RepID=A0A843WU11_COLES|nr:hypothetical protein [Colocasia esculenta]